MPRASYTRSAFRVTPLRFNTSLTLMVVTLNPAPWGEVKGSATLPPAIPTEVRMRRIGLAVVLAVALTLAPLVAEAQQARNIPRIGMLSNGTPSPNSPTLEAFRRGLRELGYIEGQNILLEPRYARGREERFADLAAELVRLKVDVIVASGPMIQAAVKATDTIPIVMSAGSDPSVVSLARP